MKPEYAANRSSIKRSERLVHVLDNLSLHQDGARPSAVVGLHPQHPFRCGSDHHETCTPKLAIARCLRYGLKCCRQGVPSANDACQAVQGLLMYAWLRVVRGVVITDVSIELGAQFVALKLTHPAYASTKLLAHHHPATARSGHKREACVPREGLAAAGVGPKLARGIIRPGRKGRKSWTRCQSEEVR
jgi:hypothetical protein